MCLIENQHCRILKAQLSHRFVDMPLARLNLTDTSRVQMLAILTFLIALPGFTLKTDIGGTR